MPGLRAADEGGGQGGVTRAAACVTTLSAHCCDHNDRQLFQRHVAMVDPPTRGWL
jgi:hypothetical protein